MPAGLAIAGCVFIPYAGPQDAALLVGRWRSVETSQGGIGAMYEFRDDGIFRFSPGAIVDMPYRLEDGQSILISAGQQDGGTYHRQGGQPDLRNPLVGEWLGSRRMDGRNMEMRFIFDGSGVCQMPIKFATEQGRLKRY